MRERADDADALVHRFIAVADRAETNRAMRDALAQAFGVRLSVDEARRQQHRARPDLAVIQSRDTAAATRKASSSRAPFARLATRPPRKLPPAPTALTTSICIGCARRVSDFVTSSAPSSPSVSATISVPPLPISLRQAAMRASSLSS